MGLFMEKMNFPMKQYIRIKYMNITKNNWWQKCIYMKQMNSKFDEK